MPHLSVNDMTLYYEELGHGETILFLHSHFSRGILAFGAQIQPFQGKYHCLFPDFRGHGRTVCDDLTWDSRRIADDMICFLDELKIDQAHLIGYSMGTYVGMYMASTYPKRIRSFTSIGGSIAPVPKGSEDFLPEKLIERNDTAFIEDMRLRHMDAHKGNWQEFLRQTVADWREHPNMTDGQWEKIQCPVLFINGEFDPFGSCKELKEKCPHAKIYEVAGSGHRPHFVMEQGKEINKLILDFLETVK